MFNLTGRYVVVDTETTGQDTESGVIVEIGAVEVIDGVITGNYFHSFVNPLNPINYHSFLLHKIGNKFLQDKPTFSQIIDDFVLFLGDAVIAGHAVHADIIVINKEFRACSRACFTRDKSLCTQKIAKPLGTQLSLTNLCRILRIPVGRTHRALVDAKLTAKCLVALSKIELPPLPVKTKKHRLKRKRTTKQEYLAMLGEKDATKMDQPAR